MVALLFLMCGSESLAQRSLEQIVYATGGHEKNFREFLDQWEKEYYSIIPRNDTVKIIYDAYRQLFTPFDLKEKASFNSDATINSGYQYIVVPGSFLYYVSSNGKDSDRDLTKFTIEQFRPKLNLGSGVKVLFLTEKYDTLLQNFLGTTSTQLGSPDIMTPSRATGMSAEREVLVKKFLPILHGHWGGYWHLTSMPTIIMIFNRKFSKAEVHFRIGYGGRINSYKKDYDGKWRRIKDEYIREWVE